MTALPGETPGTVGTDTPQDTVSPPDTGAEGSAHADAPEAPGATEPPGDAAGAGEPAAEVSGTDVAAAEDRPAEVPDAEAGPADADAEDGSDGVEDAPAEESAGDLEADAVTADGTAEAPAVPELSEAQAELAAQRELRERIEKRKAEKTAPIAAGTGLSGTAAELLAAVRAVESGEKSGTAFFDSPAPAPAARRPEPAATAVQPPRASVPAAPAPQAASPEALDAVRAVLVAGGAPEALARPAVGVLGEQAAELLRTDPWQLLAVPGVRPEQADGFARALLGDGCGPDDGRRTAALVGWLLERAALQGHTALDAGAVRAALAERAVGDPDAAVRNAVEEGVALVFREGDDLEPDDAEAADGEGDEEGAADGSGLADEADREPAQVLLGLDRYALAEESLADGLARLVNACEKAADWAEAAAAAPSPSAAELIRTTAAAGLVAHSGGEAARAEPAALIAAARGLGLRALGATHSEDGRRRLAAAVGDPDTAVTLAGLLSGAQGPGRDEDGALALDLLVVLDAPQLDVENAAVLVEALADGARLVLSGDPGVLGSAGAGRVFADVLAARACPQVVSRTPDPGPIGELVSGIGIGELNQVDAPGKEVVIVPVRDAGEAVHRTVQLVADSVPRAFSIPAEETQVITVGHGGAAGTRALNEALKQRLNPGPGRFGGFDPGDRVVHVPAPGRAVPGVVRSADAEGLRLDCGGVPVVVPQERVESSVRHGWALSAHQAAGMRWPAAVVVLPGDAAQGLSRPWVYTAFGRGERHLSVVHGVDQALPHAVAHVPAQERTTRLRPLLEALPTPDAAS
ncbi:helix-hairpin-helix domain-containing protein [Streptomyces sp. ATCC51928]|uniref:Helix-hairpin-helix domain-containing protein n=1 Tax=Streptomyces caviscabies TaxID=90079 RepID=A0ABW2MED3_9ACTN|nr:MULTISPECIES: helix-hairpin-helix domain-containing protein [unclassified Streptomyces]MDX3340132.1 helix-hairpin-helix domain-containing protein [Streptomyces sp. ME02-6979.5a]MDX3506838.1 helix-hairpin-helix domain-containing protein [Streptomyces sp. ATCC51928]MDX5526033.1 helix-hairpin-helix domain-containing protein [Streptomyces sp. DE06-01C]